MTVSIKAYINSARRVQALGELAHRYRAIITGLADAVDAALDEPDLDAELRERLVRTLKDTEAEVTAAGDALSAAMADLPEGQS